MNANAATVAAWCLPELKYIGGDEVTLYNSDTGLLFILAQLFLFFYIEYLKVIGECGNVEKNNLIRIFFVRQSLLITSCRYHSRQIDEWCEYLLLVHIFFKLVGRFFYHTLLHHISQRSVLLYYRRVLGTEEILFSVYRRSDTFLLST